MPLIPYVIEKSGREERAMDIYSRLLKDRIVFLGTQVNDVVSNNIVAQLLFLQFDDPKADIHLYINSPGGSFSALTAIYDINADRAGKLASDLGARAFTSLDAFLAETDIVTVASIPTTHGSAARAALHSPCPPHSAPEAEEGQRSAQSGPT